MWSCGWSCQTRYKHRIAAVEGAVIECRPIHKDVVAAEFNIIITANTLNETLESFIGTSNLNLASVSIAGINNYCYIDWCHVYT